jgi:hypothetical protein
MTTLRHRCTLLHTLYTEHSLYRVIQSISTVLQYYPICNIHEVRCNKTTVSCFVDSDLFFRIHGMDAPSHRRDSGCAPCACTDGSYACAGGGGTFPSHRACGVHVSLSQTCPNTRPLVYCTHIPNINNQVK